MMHLFRRTVPPLADAQPSPHATVMAFDPRLASVDRPAVSLSRRRLIAGSAALIAAPMAAIAATETRPNALVFDVMRNGSRIGHHTVQLQPANGTLVARVNVEIAVGLGPIILYRYTHTVRETWREGEFVSMESETNDDGTRHRVQADRRDNGVVVRTGDGKSEVMPADTIPLTHWNYRCMSAPLFNPQTGKRVAPQVQPRGQDTVALSDGRSVRATRYSLSGDVVLDDWYDTARAWTALRSTGTDGSAIAYVRRA